MNLYISVLVLLFLMKSEFVRSSCLEQCVPACTCTIIRTGCHVVCSGKKLTKIPFPFPNDTVSIDLSDNLLKFIPNLAFSYLKRLRYLKIDDNKLSKLDWEAFRGLNQLRELSLEGNELFINIGTFNYFFFRSMVRLKTLKLRRNMQYMGNYLNLSIIFLRSLRSLYIVGFRNKVFGFRYRRLKHLKYVNFSSKRQPSLMKFIPGRAFDNLIHLKYLNLSYCKINAIHKDVFINLKHLEVLDLSHNRNLTFSRLRPAFQELNNCKSLKTLDISAVHSVFGLGTEFTVNDALNLRNTSLSELRLNSNKLELFQTGAISLLPKTLEVLSIEDNRFSFGIFVFEMLNLPNLRLIDCSFQSKQHHLPVSSLRSTSDNYKQKSYNLSSISIETLLFRECYLKYPLPYVNLRCISNVRYINASGNMFCPWNGPLRGLEGMTLLDLSNNMCSDVSNEFFNHFSSLRKLYIHDNLLGISRRVNDFSLVFRKLKCLEVLKLSNNHITTFSAFSLINQHHLKKLDLSNNLLQSFSLRIGHMRYLSILDLSENFLSDLSLETLKDIENISLSRHITVNLKNNQLHCSCNHLKFLKWMLSTKKQSKTIQLMYNKCSFKNGTLSNLEGDSLENIVNYLDKNCSSFLSLILSSGILILVFIALLVLGLIYRYRWNLRYFYFMVKDKYVYLGNRNENYAFDAFVSYSEEDAEFVINQMIPELEEQANLTLNIHQRDFIPGREIVENILSALQESRFCLVLLSRGFLASKWCMYEFSMAKMETLYAGRNMVVVIMLEEVDPKTVPLELMHHLKTKSYIEYPSEGNQGKTLFWNQIRDILKKESQVTM